MGIRAPCQRAWEMERKRFSFSQKVSDILAWFSQIMHFPHFWRLLVCVWISKLFFASKETFPFHFPRTFWNTFLQVILVQYGSSPVSCGINWAAEPSRLSRCLQFHLPYQSAGSRPSSLRMHLGKAGWSSRPLLLNAGSI